MTLIEQHVGKSFGGMCDDFVELLDARGEHTFPDMKLAAFEEEVVPAEGYQWEKLFFVPDTAQFVERERQVGGALMKECELRFQVASDKHTNVHTLDLISRFPWHVKFRDQNHRVKIIGGRNGRGAMVRPIERNNKRARADRNEYEVSIVYADRHPVVEYKFGNTDLYPPPPPTTVMTFNSAYTGNGHSDAVGFAIGLLGNANCTIDWGDGNTEVITTDGDVFHQYTASGSYTVSIVCPTGIIMLDMEASIYGTYANCTLNLTSCAELGATMYFSYMPNFTSCGPIHPQVGQVVMQGSAMPQSNMDSILVNLDENGMTSGLVSINLNTPAVPPSATGLAAKASLEGKGWAVNVDV